MGLLLSTGDLDELAQDSGCHVTLGRASTSQGGARRFLVQAPTAEAFEKARMHLQIWLDVYTGAGAAFSAPSLTFGGAQASSASFSAGMASGFPPPAGFP